MSTSAETSATLRPVSYPENGLADYIAVSRYARYDPALRRRETWAEAVARVERMHGRRYSDRDLQDAWRGAQAAGEIPEAMRTLLPQVAGSLIGGTLHQGIADAFAHVVQRRVLPSMRSLQFGGDAILTKHERIYNCAFLYLDRAEAFREVFYLLLCGCGVGFSVQRQHVARLPCLAPEPRVETSRLTWLVEDTIEGWADALGALVQGAIEGRRIAFDYGSIRPAGAPLRTSGGKAPGPEPLMHALTHVGEILRSAAGRRLRPIEAYDCVMWIAKAVLSGGIRRSATICLFSIDDEEMTAAKTGNWFETHPQRAASNNSAVIVRATATRDEFERLFSAQKQFGEPGFYFVEDADHGANPCVEIGLHPKLTVDAAALARLRELGYRDPVREGDVLTGVQFCNLTTLSAAAVDSAEAFYRLCARAAFIGTLQAGYTDFPYLSPVSRVITERCSGCRSAVCWIVRISCLMRRCCRRARRW